MLVEDTEQPTLQSMMDLLREHVSVKESEVVVDSSSSSSLYLLHS
jgi:hypothetical protein